MAVRFTPRRAELALLLDPELKFGEAYMDGTLVVEQGSIADVLADRARPDRTAKPPHWARAAMAAPLLSAAACSSSIRANARARNVAHHYDLDGRLYSLFLDADRQYSCAYFETPDQSLDDAQLAKKRHLAAKLLLEARSARARHRLRLGRARALSRRDCGANVTGVTLSEEQLAHRQRARGREGLSRQARVPPAGLSRRRPSSFDRIVSVGMFEHVGVGHYDTFFRKCAELLDDDGVMVLHSIGRSEGPSVTNPWIAKYIFPGGYIPALSEVLPAIERAGLLVTDIEILRLHYAETLKAWRERFLAHRDEVERIYDERFVRMWEFYLAASEMAFREQDMMVFQIQLTKRQGVVPMTRDYIAPRGSDACRAIESSSRPPLRLAGE